VGPLARPGNRLAILYRLQRRRAGGVEAEIVAARPAGASAPAPPAEKPSVLAEIARA
jgi:hypothetical protein